MMLGHATATVIGAAHCNVLVVPRAAQIEGRRIILATDGSRPAEAAAVTGMRLAQACKTPITAVSVTTPSHGPERRAEAEQAVQRVVKHMKTEGIEAEGRVPHGRPDEMVVSVAYEQNADLIITGSHGRTGLDRVLIGSTTERILNQTPSAVLVVKTS